MFSYENGLGIAFILWVVGNINVLVMINSKLQHNLNKIGDRLSWLTLTAKPMNEDDIKRSNLSRVFKFIFIAGIGLLSVLLSWLYVALFVGAFIYRRVKDAGAPQAIREFRWKMRNIDMSFDQLIKEIMKISDEDPANFETIRENTLQELKNRGLL